MTPSKKWLHVRKRPLPNDVGGWDGGREGSVLHRVDTQIQNRTRGSPMKAYKDVAGCVIIGNDGRAITSYHGGPRCESRSWSTCRLGRAVWSVATGNQWSGLMKSFHQDRFHWFALRFPVATDRIARLSREDDRGLERWQTVEDVTQLGQLVQWDFFHSNIHVASNVYNAC